MNKIDPSINDTAVSFGFVQIAEVGLGFVIIFPLVLLQINHRLNNHSAEEAKKPSVIHVKSTFWFLLPAASHTTHPP